MATTYTSQAVTDNLLPFSTVLATSGFLQAIQDELSLLAHPAIVDVAGLMPPDFFVGAPTNATFRIPVDMATPLMTSTTETTDVVGPTTIDYSTATISTGAYDIAFGVSDELRRRDAVNGYQVVRIAGKIAQSAQLTVTNLIVALAGSASSSVGTSGSPLTWDIVLEGRDDIVAAGLSAATGPFVAILHPAQWALVRQDLAAATGARAERRELDIAQMSMPVGYQGSYDGIDVYTCDRVALSSGDYTGMVFAAGAIGRLLVPPAAAATSEIRVLDLSPVCAVEEVRNAADKSIQLNGQMTVGVSILRQELIRGVVSTGA